MEFENYERELKYLIKKNEKYTSKQFLEFIYENGYKLVESFEKEKHETYYDDNDFSILKRGDVMRGSNMVTEQFKGFLYKTNKCNPQKPYVSKLELGTKLRGQRSIKHKIICKYEKRSEHSGKRWGSFICLL